MSGSPSRTTWGSGSGGGDFDCAALVLETLLGSPDPAIVAALVIGEVLKVELHDGPPRVIAAVTTLDQIVGGIAPTGQLLRCIQDGQLYVATVAAINGGAVTVRVRAAT